MVFIYPNPNNGQFQVQYFNGTNVTQNLVITLYDEKAHGYTKTLCHIQHLPKDGGGISGDWLKGTYML